MLTAIVGINWGDEGKGRMVDLLSKRYGIVARYQGGNNAGHTVINERGKFILNLLPSGILREGVVNVMGPGMVIDLKHLCGEIDRLEEKGVAVTPENLKISDRAVICMPYHVRLDCLEEERLKDQKFGSTRRGIAPVYGDKYMKKKLLASLLAAAMAVTALTGCGSSDTAESAAPSMLFQVKDEAFFNTKEAEPENCRPFAKAPKPLSLNVALSRVQEDVPEKELSS